MERKKFIDFQKYGYFIGGLVPILITSLLSLLTSHKVFDSNYTALIAKPKDTILHELINNA